MKKRKLFIASAMIVAMLSVGFISADQTFAGGRSMEDIMMGFKAMKSVDVMVAYYNTYPASGGILNIDYSPVYPPDNYGNTYDVGTEEDKGATYIKPVTIVNEAGAIETLTKYLGADEAKRLVAEALGKTSVTTTGNGLVDNFDAAFYYNTYSDLQAVFAANDVAGLYQHYLTFGKNEGRVCHK